MTVADTFFKQFEILADAPNAVPRLRELILQLAVRGKLVSQDPNDEPASVLLEKIQQQQKSKKNLLAPIDTSNSAYEIPKNWLWVRLGNIQDFVNGYAFRSQDYQFDGVGIVRIGDIKDGEVKSESMKFVSEDFLNTIDSKFQVNPDDLLIAMSGATTGKLGFNKTKSLFLLNQRVGKINFISTNEKYGYFYLSTKIKDNLLVSAGSAIPNLSTEQINNIEFPLPPLNEQKRIVEKVDKLMEWCDRLEKQQQQRRETCINLNRIALTQLTTAKTTDEFSDRWQKVRDNFDLLYSLPENVSQLRQTILQLAVMGKLVKQEFECQRTFLKLSQICSIIQTGPFGSLLHASDYVLNQIPLINPQNIQEDRIKPNFDKIISEETRKRLKTYIVKEGDLVIARRGDVGRCAIIGKLEDGWLCGTGCLFIRLPHNISPQFLKLYFDAPITRQILQSTSVGSTMNNLNQKILGALEIDLPPLNEQKRIVAKVEEMMRLCDGLEAKLKDTEINRQKLLESGIRQVLSQI